MTNSLTAIFAESTGRSPSCPEQDQVGPVVGEPAGAVAEVVRPHPAEDGEQLSGCSLDGWDGFSLDGGLHGQQPHQLTSPVRRPGGSRR